MSYDISVRFSDEKEVENMLSFLSTVREELARLEKTESAFFKINFNTGTNVGAYAPSTQQKCLISMHGTGIPSYAWALCCWMACKSAYRNEQGLPLIYYDDEEIPIYGTNACQDQLQADDDGILIRKSPPRLFHMLKLGTDYEAQTVIMREINSKYRAFCLYARQLDIPYR